ncbi:MAG TPA: hypothetical protein DCL21_05205 [Alphaproteobacteria bacterium]|nr:hypothetical protein [Alphaproteobacteria bacterium]
MNASNTFNEITRAALFSTIGFFAVVNPWVSLTTMASLPELSPATVEVLIPEAQKAYCTNSYGQTVINSDVDHMTKLSVITANIFEKTGIVQLLLMNAPVSYYENMSMEKVKNHFQYPTCE